jgi:16S rRNA (cytidine1402-2'-O)-methyltransferase
MAGTLFVVATPIGHLDDITLRALKVLKSVALIAAEDTRRTGQLLRHFDIPTPLTSLHAHNERRRVGHILARLSAGHSVALVSDAGTPGLSDPGAILVQEARAAGHRVEPIPGPSAITAALSVAGIPEAPFVFLGFPPIRSNDRKLWFQQLAERHATLTAVVFEAPHRILQTIDELANLVESPIIVLRELTKVHEEVLTGPPHIVRQALEPPRGEYTIVIPRQAVREESTIEVQDADLRVLFGEMTKSNPGASRRETVKKVAQRFRVKPRRVYDATKHVD